ncbi:hypothetical protein IWZ01DRAFT_120316 [Phyllosticta capitalensis]
MLNSGPSGTKAEVAQTVQCASRRVCLFGRRARIHNTTRAVHFARHSTFCSTTMPGDQVSPPNNSRAADEITATMHVDPPEHPGRKIAPELSPLGLSERERSSLLRGPTLRVDVEVETTDGERSMWTVGTFPRAMLSQFSSVIARFVAKNPFATDIAFVSDVNPTALAYVIDWMMEICTISKVNLLPMTMDLHKDLDVYFVVRSLHIDDAEKTVGDGLIFFIKGCAWDLDAYATMVNKLPLKSRVMDQLLLTTLYLCHEDMLPGFDKIRAILKPLPKVRDRMRVLDLSIEDPVEADNDISEMDAQAAYSVGDVRQMDAQAQYSVGVKDEMDLQPQNSVGAKDEMDLQPQYSVGKKEEMHEPVEKQAEMDVDVAKPGPKMGYFRPQSRMPGSFGMMRNGL